MAEWSKALRLGRSEHPPQSSRNNDPVCGSPYRSNPKTHLQRQDIDWHTDPAPMHLKPIPCDSDGDLSPSITPLRTSTYDLAPGCLACVKGQRITTPRLLHLVIHVYPCSRCQGIRRIRSVRGKTTRNSVVVNDDEASLDAAPQSRLLGRRDQRIGRRDSTPLPPSR